MASDASMFNFAAQLGEPENRFVAGIGGDASGEAAKEAA